MGDARGTSVLAASAALAACALLGGGCGGGARMIARDQPVVLAEGEGLLALAVDSGVSVEVIPLCRERDVLQCIDLTRFPAGRSIRVVAVPEGLWCLDRFALELMGVAAGITYRASPDRRTECVTVQRGGTSYSGTLVFRTEATDSAAELVDWGFADRRSTFRDELIAEYPSVASLPVHFTELTGR